MSIQSEINRLKQNISDSFTAVGEKGGTVPGSKVSGNLAAAIDSIPQGVELNFEVVGGTSAPVNPRENTLWVNTGTQVTKWAIAVDNPYMTKENLYPANEDSGVVSGYYLDSDNTYVSDSNYKVISSITLPVNTVSVTIPTSISDSTQAFHIFQTVDGSLISSAVRNPENFTYDVPGNAHYLRASVSTKDFKSIIANVNTAVSGDVWITADTIPNAGAFNALKVNGIQVYPLSARQYINGVWKKASAKIYRNGEWGDCVRQIYERGKTEYILETKGLKHKSTSVYTAVAPTAGSDSTSFWASVNVTASSGGREGVVYFSPKIDLTNASTLYVYGVFNSDYSSSMPYIGIWSEIGTNAQENRVTFKTVCSSTSEKVTKTVAVDVSKLAGKYYIGFYLSATIEKCSVAVIQTYFD